MEAINPVRVMLFWDYEIARDAYGPYFTGTVRKTWTLPTNRFISHTKLVHRIFYFNLYSMNNDEEMRYLWTIPADLSKEGIHILVESIEQQNIPSTHDRNTTTLPEYITAVTHMISDEPSMLYSTVHNDDDEVDGSDGDDAVSSQSESDDDNDPEEEEFHSPLNPENPVTPVTENIVQQWESSQ
ncbi:hypothetical protein M9H77_14252 [Catharanthus roseus]|uniref:Uncharacterized protein n=1 Tax=Catharanthus roseus TaxID=4058 RepID=A0ACC0BMS0_CATRO|nr:hypothetical protein M9H77_14252 [Catharanthus roseus]